MIRKSLPFVLTVLAFIGMILYVPVGCREIERASSKGQRALFMNHCAGTTPVAECAKRWKELEAAR